MAGRLIMICGLPGAGKTTLAKKLEVSRSAVRLCPDEWIYQIAPDRKSADEIRDQVERIQLTAAVALLNLGATVILENGFWGKAERLTYRLVAFKAGVPVELHYLEVPIEELWRRLELRNSADERGTFHITREELSKWWNLFEAPTEQEIAHFTQTNIYL